MKSQLIISAGVLCAAAAFAGNFQVDWFTIDGGGGASSSGAYALSGTIGQPDAADSSSSGFKLRGGFWPAFNETVRSTNGPNLRIARAPVGVIVSWSADYPDYQLEATATVPSTNWFSFPTPPVAHGLEFQMILPANQPTRFFRLHKL